MIHKFSMNGYNIVLDVDGGSVHILDDVAYELVDLYEENTKEEIISKLENKFTAEQIEEAYDEITSLKEEGLLFTTDTYEFNPNFINREKVVKALCLHVSHDCNLRCKYCFASQGDFGGEKEIMNFEVGKAAIDYLIANSGNRRNLEIDFFGGEPLMNFDVVKQLVEYGRSIEKENDKNTKIGKHDKADHVNEIQEGLNQREKDDGAFFCSYLSFMEGYRYVRRVIERSGQSAYLLLCTMTDGKGVPLEKGERLGKVAEELEQAIRNSLRRGDMFTRYSDNQFLMLLLGIRQEDCAIVVERINGYFEKASRKNYLKYSTAPISEIREADDCAHFHNMDSMWGE